MYQRILVPVDGSATSSAGLAEAIKLAKLTGARVRVLHVVDEMPFIMSVDGYGAMPGDVFTVLKEAGQAVFEQARLTVQASGIPGGATLVDNLSGRLCDHVAEQMQEWGADVIVPGTHGRRGVGRMRLDRDAEQIVRTATVPVPLVRGTPSEAVLQYIKRTGVDVQALAAKLQQNGARALVKSWQQPLQRIAEKAVTHKPHSAQSNPYKTRERQNQLPSTGLSLFTPGGCLKGWYHRTMTGEPYGMAYAKLAIAGRRHRCFSTHAALGNVLRPASRTSAPLNSGQAAGRVRRQGHRRAG